VRRAVSILALCALFGVVLGAPATSRGQPSPGTPLPRAVLALYDGEESASPRLTLVHQLAEMPLNHLGLYVVYWDIQDGLPDLADYEDLRGIITWFTRDSMPDPVGYLGWATAAVESGLRLVVMNDLGAWGDLEGRPAPEAAMDRLFGALGLRCGERYVDVTYRCRVAVLDREVMEFERPLSPVLPAFEFYEAVDPEVRTHLGVEIDGNPALVSHLVVSGPRGGFAANGFTHYSDRDDERRQWILDPFAFFARCFATDDLPKPDYTTLSGRRIYYSHIDGDGWFNATEIDGYVERQASSAEVLLERAFEPYPDLPVTVGPVTAEFEARRYGSPEALEVLRRIFALPQVEAGTHTHTHPYDWGFFADYTPDKERRFKSDAAARSLVGKLMHEGEVEGSGGYGDTGLVNDYAQPRAYLDEPFRLEEEIGGSAAFLIPYLPPGKRVEIVQWSGNTSPFPRAIRSSRESGLRNINGGDARFDPAFPSYAHVSGVGLAVGEERQIFASGSNEVIYTDNWQGRYHGLRDHRHFVRNTGSPRRVSPFNLYYHMFSGQKQASLNAVLLNLELARSGEYAPVATSRYAAVGDGFYSARLVALGERRWRIEDRDGLQTIRFDGATRLGVDFARSTGVIGQRHQHGRLYVALDPAVAAPVLVLRDADRTYAESPAAQPYLVHARWLLRDVRRVGDELHMSASGFGAGDMVWCASPGTGYEIEARDVEGVSVWTGTAVADDDGRFDFSVAADAIAPLELRIRAVAGSRGGA